MTEKEVKNWHNAQMLRGETYLDGEQVTRLSKYNGEIDKGINIIEEQND